MVHGFVGPSARRKATLLLVLTLGLASAGCVREAIRVTDTQPPVDYIPPSLAAGDIEASGAVGRLRAEIFRAEDLPGGRIRLYVNVLDSLGRAVTGLGRHGRLGRWCRLVDSSASGDREVPFAVHEAGRETSDPVAITLVLDHSGSMGEERTRRLQEAVNTMLAHKAAHDEIGAIKFDVDQKMVRPLSADSLPIPVVGLAGFGRETAMFDACAVAVDRMEPVAARGDFRPAIVLLTDGMDNASSTSAARVLESARRAGIPIFTVRFGPAFDRTATDELVDLGRISGGQSYHIYHRDQFAPVFDDILTRLQSFYVIELDGAENGWNRLELTQCWAHDSVTAEAHVLIRGDLPEPAYARLPVTIDLHTPAAVVTPPDSDPGRREPVSFEAIGIAKVGGRTGNLLRVNLEDSLLALDSTGVMFPLGEFVREDMLDPARNAAVADAWRRMLAGIDQMIRRGGHRYSLIVQGYADISAFHGRDSVPFRTVRGMQVDRYLAQFPAAHRLLANSYDYLSAAGGTFEYSGRMRFLSDAAYNNRELAFLRGAFIRDRIAWSGLLDGVPILLVDGVIEQRRDPKLRTIALYLFQEEL